MPRHFSYLLLALSLTLASCKKDLDMTLLEKQLYEEVAFDAIIVEDAWEVTVIQDDVKRGVVVEYSAFLEEYLKVKRDGSELVVGFTNRLNLPSETVFRATVYVPTLQSLKATKASRMTLEGTFAVTGLLVDLDQASVLRGGSLMGDDAEILLDNASTVVDLSAEITSCRISLDNTSVFKGRLQTQDHLDILMDDASRMTLYGDLSPKVTAHLTAASMLNMLAVEVADMEVHLNTASEANVKVTGDLTGTLNEASVLYYQGQPNIQLSCDATSNYYPL